MVWQFLIEMLRVAHDTLDELPPAPEDSCEVAARSLALVSCIEAEGQLVGMGGLSDGYRKEGCSAADPAELCR